MLVSWAALRRVGGRLLTPSCTLLLDTNAQMIPNLPKIKVKFELIVSI
jgi:hypothetical protein